MQRGSGQSAAKVGLLVIVFAILLIGGYRFLGGQLFSKRNRYYVLLPDANGILPGTAVKQAGVQIGTVTTVGLANPKLAKLTLELNPDNHLPVGGTAVVPASLIGIGDSQLDIVPPEVGAGDLPVGASISGRRAGPLDALFPDAKSTFLELNATLVATRKLLENKGMANGVQGVLASTKKTLDKFSILADQSHQLINDNQASLRLAMLNASAAMADVREGTTMALKLVKSGKYQKETLALLKQLNATSAKADHLVASLDKFVSDPKLRASIDATLENTQKLTAQGNDIATSFKTISKNGEAISEQAITLTARATEVAEQAKNLLGDLQGLVKKVSGKLGSSPGKGLVSKIEAETSVSHEFNPSYNRIDFNFKLPIGGQTIYTGVFDAFESNKLDLQLGRPIGRSGLLRYGMYASKPALGVDYSLTPDLGLRADLFDINNPRFDLRARLAFGGGLIGWIGYDSLFGKNNVTLGIGFQK